MQGMAKKIKINFFLTLIIFVVLLVIGVRESTKLNNVFTALNLITVVVVLIAGAIKSKFIFGLIALYQIFQG